MYMCVRGISQESDRSCICVLGVSVRKVTGHVYVMYMCVRGISQESDWSCICVLGVSVRKVTGHVYVC